MMRGWPVASLIARSPLAQLSKLQRISGIIQGGFKVFWTYLAESLPRT